MTDQLPVLAIRPGCRWAVLPHDTTGLYQPVAIPFYRRSSAEDLIADMLTSDLFEAGVDLFRLRGVVHRSYVLEQTYSRSA